MKKLIVALSLVTFITLSLSSCNKGDSTPLIQQKYTVQLAENEDYVFVLPESIRHDEYKFTTQASHYSISILGKNSKGDQIYQYTPMVNYMGVDRVVVNNGKDETQHPQCGPNGNCQQFGNCMGVQDSRYEITIDFVIGRSNLNASK